MKSSELRADEIRIETDTAGISISPEKTTPLPPVEKAAMQTAEAALMLRGKGSNLFICGPSAPDRLEFALYAAENLQAPGTASDLVLYSKPESSGLKAGAVETASGEGEAFIESLPGGDSVLLVSNGGKRPVIVEESPEPRRLFGSNKGWKGGIECGSLIRSSGGVLIISAEDLLEEEQSWKLLRRALRSGLSLIGSGSPQPGPCGSDSGLPEIPEITVDLKLIIHGSESHYDHLYGSYEDFSSLFQYFAELDSVIDLNPETLAMSVNRFRRFTQVFQGMVLTDEAAAETIKFSCALAENRNRLSSCFSEIESMLTEACTASDSAGELTAADITATINRQSERYSLLEKRLLEDIKCGEINLKVEGRATGKVNGLAIIEKGPYAFGFPGLISARIAPGESGLVNIEHEAGLSGEIHDKWVLILEGFLRSSFALDFPISIFASICFEQSYSEIDGDSASSSELYALLSAIADVPVRQDIAVTGSLSQTGEIQAVGGIREKIMGFYNACRALNYTGDQGVIIPDKNINSVILPDDLISEIEAGRFHIYPVASVDEAMEILTGMEAGKRGPRGSFPHGSLNSLIEKNLKRFAQLAKSFGS